MCGIVAAFGAGADSIPPGTLEAMTDSVRHRGPDASGIWCDANAGVALGHRRLSILDLSELGAQPMVSASGRYVLSMNGELYNYRALRETLRASGATFRGTSDTEVALAAFERWGVAVAIPNIAGMFAMTLWDRTRGELTLVRDRLGEKPLYYGIVAGRLVVASELRAFARVPGWVGEVDRDVLALYLRGNYVPGPYSIFRSVRKLPPGEMLSVTQADVRQGTIPAPKAYWSVADGGTPPGSGSPVQIGADPVQSLDDLLTQVVGEQMASDVPLGALLSGGIDSSLVVALMQKHSSRTRTFTIRFEDKAFDESAYARTIATHLRTEHTELTLRAEEALAIIPQLPRIYDEPFADSSQIALVAVSQLARQHVTVCLSGDGGDEAFCGYNRHVALARVARLSQRVPSGIRNALAGALDALPTRFWDALFGLGGSRLLGEQVQKLASILRCHGVEEMYRSLTTFWPDPTQAVIGSRLPPSLLATPSEWPAFKDPIETLLWVEAKTSLPDDMLVKVDRGAMSVGLETRSPFVDHRIVDFAWSLPLEFRVRGKVGKWISREVLAKYVPRSMSERPKAGFGVPIDRWLRKELRPWAEALLDRRRLEREGYFNPAVVHQCWNEHLSGRRKWHSRLWGVLMFQAWNEVWST